MSESAIKELHWWVHNVFHAYNKISHVNPYIVVTSDASKTGVGDTCMGQKTGGNWTLQEALSHINILEIWAAYFVLTCFSYYLLYYILLYQLPVIFILLYLFLICCVI